MAQVIKEMNSQVASSLAQEINASVMQSLFRLSDARLKESFSRQQKILEYVRTMRTEIEVFVPDYMVQVKNAVDMYGDIAATASQLFDMGEDPTNAHWAMTNLFARDGDALQCALNARRYQLELADFKANLRECDVSMSSHLVAAEDAKDVAHLEPTPKNISLYSELAGRVNSYTRHLEEQCAMRLPRVMKMCVDLENQRADLYERCRTSRFMMG